MDIRLKSSKRKSYNSEGKNLSALNGNQSPTVRSSISYHSHYRLRFELNQSPTVRSSISYYSHYRLRFELNLERKNRGFGKRSASYAECFEKYSNNNNNNNNCNTGNNSITHLHKRSETAMKPITNFNKQIHPVSVYKVAQNSLDDWCLTLLPSVSSKIHFFTSNNIRKCVQVFKWQIIQRKVRIYVTISDNCNLSNCSK